jgi:hypothetical protein
MGRQVYRVENPFRARMDETKAERVFKPGETLWWDGNELSDPVTFEVDNILFEAELKRFLAGVRLHN